MTLLIWKVKKTRIHAACSTYLVLLYIFQFVFFKKFTQSDECKQTHVELAYQPLCRQMCADQPDDNQIEQYFGFHDFEDLSLNECIDECIAMIGDNNHPKQLFVGAWWAEVNMLTQFVLAVTALSSKPHIDRLVCFALNMVFIFFCHTKVVSKEPQQNQQQIPKIDIEVDFLGVSFFFGLLLVVFIFQSFLHYQLIRSRELMLDIHSHFLFFKHLVDNSKDGLMVVDDHGDQGFHLAYSNKTSRDLLIADQEDLLQKSVLKKIDKDNQDQGYLFDSVGRQDETSAFSLSTFLKENINKHEMCEAFNLHQDKEQDVGQEQESQEVEVEGQAEGYIDTGRQSAIKQSKKKATPIILDLQTHKYLTTQDRQSKILTLRDVTRIDDRLSQTTRCHLKELVYSSISNDMRGPLMIISRVCRSLLKKKGIQKIAGPLKLILHQTLLLYYNVNDILDLSMIQTGRFKLNNDTFKIKEVVQRVIENFEEQSKLKNITIIPLFDNSVPAEVLSDKTRIEQVLTNLISNGIKFNEKGELTVSVSYISDDNPNKIEISVQDQGLGIALEEQGLLFKEFSKLPSNASMNPNGLGLGLSICKKLVKQMNGNIKLISEPGQGSKFIFQVQVFTKTNGIHSESDQYLISEDLRLDNLSSNIGISEGTLKPMSLSALTDQKNTLRLLQSTKRLTKTRSESSVNTSQCERLISQYPAFAERNNVVNCSASHDSSNLSIEGMRLRGIEEDLVGPNQLIRQVADPTEIGVYHETQKIQSTQQHRVIQLEYSQINEESIERSMQMDVHQSLIPSHGPGQNLSFLDRLQISNEAPALVTPPSIRIGTDLIESNPNLIQDSSRE